MKRHKVNFEYKKDFGSVKKGTKKVLKKTFALQLEKAGAGKIVLRKAVKPSSNKVDKDATNKVDK